MLSICLILPPSNLAGLSPAFSIIAICSGVYAHKDITRNRMSNEQAHEQAIVQEYNIPASSKVFDEVQGVLASNESSSEKAESLREIQKDYPKDFSAAIGFYGVEDVDEIAALLDELEGGKSASEIYDKAIEMGSCRLVKYLSVNLCMR